MKKKGRSRTFNWCVTHGSHYFISENNNAVVFIIPPEYKKYNRPDLYEESDHDEL